jgi:mycothiol maleylpyruvate isomerase-like protein
MLDLKPATDALAAIAVTVTDDQLTLPTPCEKVTVADLLDHVVGLSTGFTMAAHKQIPEGARHRREPTARGSVTTGAGGSPRGSPASPRCGATRWRGAA